jgi:hypothetical protein
MEQNFRKLYKFSFLHTNFSYEINLEGVGGPSDSSGHYYHLER